ncbi:MAG: hypothetical protein F7B17_01005 [Desulfurococcales archaeon]|nr:hypothetical protein [Desulfurococcales archaeon]
MAIFSPEVVYPSATGVILLASSAIGFRIYRVSGNLAVFWLALGLVFVAAQSFMEAYINYRIDVVEGFYGSRQHYMLDAFRGVLIVLWAFAQALILVDLAGVRERWVYYGLPAVILISGTVYTFAVNLGADIGDPANKILVSSVGRVLGILVPVSLLLGVFIILSIARPTGSRGALVIGVAFILHAVTLPLYSVAKSLGPVTLGLWYAFGGIIPALAALYGFWQLAREAAG